MTTANKITLARIAMIPFFIVCAMQGNAAFQIAALVLFCIASLTDFLDGYIARKYNQVTDFGKFVDPLADKLLVTAALLLFVEQGKFPAWMVFIILAREFIITSLRIVAANKGRVMAAAWSGKVKTCVQIAGILLTFLLTIYQQKVGEMVADGTAAVLVTGSESGSLESAFSVYYLAIAVVMTAVTLYSGWDYLSRNWDLIKDGAVK